MNHRCFWVFVPLALLWAILLAMHSLRESFGTYKDGLNASNSGQHNKGSTISGREITGNADDIFWFVQVSDIHISKFYPLQGQANFVKFLTETLRVVEPKFVVATGDLTDAKDPWPLFSSRQFEDEWKTYRRLLEESGVLNKKDYWFDIRGNHDCFDVPAETAPENLFAKYSVMKRSDYSHVFDQGFGKYAIVAIDGCPHFGPSRVFNFFGYLDTKRMDHLEKQLESLSDANHIILIGHYPTITMTFQQTSSKKSFADLSTKFTALLSGHLHHLAMGMGDQLLALQPSGFLDLEVGDLKHHSTFRVLSIDHDMLSFADVPVGQYPIILITNPKDASLYAPMHEPIGQIATSTHIRVLLFSLHEIISATIEIDGKSLEEPLKPAKTGHPLWTAKWSPSSYSAGKTHMITVKARDSQGNEHSKTQEFSIDGTSSVINSAGNKIMLFPVITMLQLAFWVIFGVILGVYLVFPTLWVLLVIRRVNYAQWRDEQQAWLCQQYEKVQAKAFYACLPSLLCWWFAAMRFRIIELARKTWYFYPMLTYALYITTGPLFYGRVSTAGPHFAGLFIHGVLKSDSWVNIKDSYMLFDLYAVVFILPSLYLMSLYVSTLNIYTTYKSVAANFTPIHHLWWYKVGVVQWWLLSSIIVALHGLEVVAFFVSPGITWHFLYASAILFYHMFLCPQAQVVY